jgi:prolyl-tRNA editing enzyme YbaK/EbsC (Cys-tRNA(Pro) deacylase)
MSDELAKGFEKDFMDSVVMAGMMVAMIMLIMPIITQQISASYSRVQTLAMSPETIAQNAGLVYYKLTPLGQPNRLQMIGENSTGAFEEILVSLST